MLFRLLLTTIFAISLSAAPSVEQMKEAVKKNPSLLNTPQAQAMLKEKGVTAAEVRAKLATKQIEKQTLDEESIENKIDIVESAESNESNESTAAPLDVSSERLNPFMYKTSADLRKELNSKQQLLSEGKLSRYSTSFYSNKNIIDSSSLPTPDNYIVSTGDVLSLHVYGDRDKTYTLNVNRNGSVDLEFIGPVKIAGFTFVKAKEHLTEKLKAHFKMSSFSINMESYSSIQVTLIGDVKHPGIYNLSSFSTAKDLLLVAKGVRESASVREILIKRNSRTIAKLDFYELLFKGRKFTTTLLKHGDVVVIQKAKKLVSIDGLVNHAAIFELNAYERLDKLIEYAGGMKANASKLNIKIDRYSNNSLFETFKMNYAKAKKFKMRDGDRVYIYPLDDSVDVSVNVYGNIIRPGSYRINSNATLTSFFKDALTQGMKKFFLPETYFEYGVIKRYSHTLNYETKSFNLGKIIDGSESLVLKPKDEIFIFSKNDIASSSYITTMGETLVNSGKLQYFSGMTLRDAVHASGLKGIIDDKIRVTTIHTPNRMPKTLFYSLKNQGSVELHPYDEVEVYDYYKTHLLEPVSIKGEVINPTTVFYEAGMTIGDLLNVSGGLTTMAYVKKVELVRYYLDEDSNRQKKIINIDLSAVNNKNYKIQPYDEVSIFKIPKWNDKKSVELKGEVMFPGVYTIGNGEKLSSVINRAGGYTEEAFIEGSVFTRESIRKNQSAQYNKSLARIKKELAIINAMPANAKKSAALSESANSLDEVMVEAKKYEPIGRVSIKLDENLTRFEDSPFNLTLKDQDTIIIPSQIDTVTVFGEVFNPTSFVYNEETSLEDYIAMASGYSRTADESSVYIIHADGTSEPIYGGWFSSAVEINKGDTIVVPIYIKENNTLDIWDSVAKILASFALTAAAVNSLGVI